jgi:hypothetical protein
MASNRLGGILRHLRRPLERAAVVEARLKEMGNEPEEVLYQGKTAAYWCKLLKDRDPAASTAACSCTR